MLIQYRIFRDGDVWPLKYVLAVSIQFTHVTC